MKLLRYAVAALAASVFTVSWAAEKCGNVGAPGIAIGDPIKSCSTSQVVQDGTLHEEDAGGGSASGEPSRAPSRAAGYVASGDVGPGYYVSDPNESQFLLDTWTKGGG
jgi:hypothetical protein